MSPNYHDQSLLSLLPLLSVSMSLLLRTRLQQTWFQSIYMISRTRCWGSKSRTLPGISTVYPPSGIPWQIHHYLCALRGALTSRARDTQARRLPWALANAPPDRHRTTLNSGHQCIRRPLHLGTCAQNLHLPCQCKYVELHFFDAFSPEWV